MGTAVSTQGGQPTCLQRVLKGERLHALGAGDNAGVRSKKLTEPCPRW